VSPETATAVRSHPPVSLLTASAFGSSHVKRYRNFLSPF
jgi:hypothetical protein